MQNNILEIEITNSNIEKIIKKTKSIKNKCDKNNLILKFNIKEDVKDKILLRDIKSIETAINLKNKEERYNYIYDTVCSYLDDRIIDENYCEFKDDICKYFREKNELTHKYGCCYSDSRGGLCNYLDKDHCTINSISCKLYSCPTLRENNINFKIREIPLLKYFFNIKQKYYLKYSFFKDKDYVINKLLEKK